jgi:hypothetical protein
MTVGRVNFKGISKIIFIILLAAIMLHSVAKQRHISNDIADIEPILKKIPPQSSILALVFNNNSPELDRRPFDPHITDHHYYYILIGGGILNPYLPDSPLFPVHLKAESVFPEPGGYMPHMFKWELHGAYYNYFLIRGLTKGVLPYITKKAVLVERSGKWLLFKKKI